MVDIGVVLTHDKNMKITTEEIIDMESIAGHIVLHYIGNDKILAEQIKRDGCAEVIVTINGKEYDFKSFANQIDNQLERMVKDKASELLESKFFDLEESIFTMKRLADEKIKKMEPEWNFD